MTLSPIIPGSSLAEDEVIGPKNLAIGPRADTVHGSGLQIHQHCSRHIPTSTGLVEVDVDSLQLQIGVAMVCPGWINAMFIANHLRALTSGCQIIRISNRSTSNADSVKLHLSLEIGCEVYLRSCDLLKSHMITCVS